MHEGEEGVSIASSAARTREELVHTHHLGTTLRGEASLNDWVAQSGLDGASCARLSHHGGDTKRHDDCGVEE